MSSGNVAKCFRSYSQLHGSVAASGSGDSRESMILRALDARQTGRPAGLTRRAGCHMFRHSFATHLFGIVRTTPRLLRVTMERPDSTERQEAPVKSCNTWIALAMALAAA